MRELRARDAGLPSTSMAVAAGRRAGEAPSTTLVLVHGVASTPATWSRVVTALGPAIRCACPALPGHGPEAGTGVGFDLDAGLALIERQRERLGVSRLNLVGHSLGAMLAAIYAARWPDRVHALALLAAPAFRSTEDRDATRAVLEAMRTDGILPVVERLLPRWYGEAFRAAEPSVVRERLDQVARIDPAAFLGAYAMYAELEIADALPRIPAPTLVLTGEHAMGCGGDLARRIAAALPVASLHILAGQRNGLLTEAPGLVADALRSFFLRSAEDRPACP